MRGFFWHLFIMADFSTILVHPKFDEILSKLLSGVSPTEVWNWLKIQFPESDQAYLRISEKVLREFSKSKYLDMHQQFRSDLEKVDNKQPIDKRIAASLLNNKTYQERLSEYSEEQLDIKREILELAVNVKARLEQIYDKIQENPGDLGNKGDYKFIQYFEKYTKLLEVYDKSVNNRPDQIIQHSYTLEYIDQRTQAIQDAIRETLEELGTEATFIFMNKMQEKMENLEFKQEKAPNVAKILQSVSLQDD